VGFPISFSLLRARERVFRPPRSSLGQFISHSIRKKGEEARASSAGIGGQASLGGQHSLWMDFQLAFSDPERGFLVFELAAYCASSLFFSRLGPFFSRFDNLPLK